MAVEESWQRSKMHGVDRHHSEPIVVPGRELCELQKQHRTWLVEAVSRAENLYGWVKRWQALTIVADRNGIILNCNGNPDFLRNASNVGLLSGANWNEAIIGTNAIGTCLEDRKSTAIIGKEHFSEKNEFLCCAASPVFSPQGDPLGAVDISSYYHLYQPTFLGLADILAKEIESALVRRDARLALRLKSEDGIWSATIAIDTNGVIAGGTREAHHGILGKIVGRPWTDVFPNVPLAVNDGKNRHNVQTIHSPSQPDARIHAEVLEDRRPFTIFTGSASTETSSFGKLKKASPIHTSSPWTARYTFEDLIGIDMRFLKAVSDARLASDNDDPVLITGETGTGKELVSQAIHTASRRAQGPFVSVNCGAIPDSLKESEWFGYVKGAFTGANSSGHPGKFEQADNGTLFLDEIGELPLHAQVILLRVLQEHQITRVGGNHLIPVNIRFVAATHRDLWKEVKNGRFREDLYYRLLGNVIEIPPLRLRRDVDFLAIQLLKRISETDEIAIPKLTNSASSFIQSHPWPGNVRELIAALRFAIRHASSTIDVEDFPAWLWREVEQDDISSCGSQSPSCQHQLMKPDILQALNETNGNKREAARILGISRSTLYRKIKDLKLDIHLQT
jgi:sigma-54 dependent transcriptional regulator, acetoin dehydrogenase operon transcriptional activator AcoR